MTLQSVFGLVVCSGCWLSLAANADDAPNDLVPLQYHDSDLVVDLGVGLWAHPLPMDFDGDGDNDLVVSCPDKPFNGTYFFENATGDVKLPVFRPPVKIGPGFHSIRVSRVGDRIDVMTPQTVYEDFLRNKFAQPKTLNVPEKPMAARKTRANQWHRVDHDNDGDQDLIIGLGVWDDYGWDDAWDENGSWENGPLHGYVFTVTNIGTDADPIWSEAKRMMAGNQPIDVFGWPSPCVADFDGDGDRDLICGEFLDRFTWFENTGTDDNFVLAAGQRVKSTAGDDLRMDLQMIVPTPIDWDKDGDTDLIVGDEDGRVAFVENVTQPSEAPVFRPPVYFQQEAVRLKFGALATPYVADLDNDGDSDIVCGNTAGYIGFFENLGGDPVRWAAPVRLSAGDATLRILAGPNGSIQGPCEAKWGYTTLSVADWDHDGRKDLIVNSIWGKVVWYRNLGRADAGSGKNEIPRFAESQPVRVAWPDDPPKPSWTWWTPGAEELVTQWRTTPEAVDFNRDGRIDLVMLDHEGYLCLFERRSDGRLNPPQRIFVDESGTALRLNERSAGGSGRRKIHVVDWDNDGDFDVLVNSQNADLLENTGTNERGQVVLQSRGLIGKRRLAGHTSSPTTIDLNGNGRLDLLVGAEDGHLYWLER